MEMMKRGTKRKETNNTKSSNLRINPLKLLSDDAIKGIHDDMVALSIGKFILNLVREHEEKRREADSPSSKFTNPG
jgi:hypothetical protein